MNNLTLTQNTNQLTKEDNGELNKEIFLGIKGIEPEDVLPPTLKLLQGTSDLERMRTYQGLKPEIGTFYYYGNRQTFEELEVYILNITKIEDIYNQTDKGKPYKMYRTIGITEDLEFHFTFNFRKTAVKSIKTLIASVFNLMKPLYTFKVKLYVESKKGHKGSYFIPALSVMEEETNEEKLKILRREALKYDTLNKLMENKPETITTETEEPKQDEGAPETETEKQNEDVYLDDIPF